MEKVKGFLIGGVIAGVIETAIGAAANSSLVVGMGIGWTVCCLTALVIGGWS